MAELLDNYAGMSVLIIDDNTSNVALVEVLLRSQGMSRVQTETDARQVPLRLLDDSPDLVLLDLHMPHVSGFETLSRIRQHAAGGYLPVLVLTGDTTSTARDRALREGAQDFLTKPIDLLEASLRISNLLNTRRLYSDLRRASLATAEPPAGLELEQTRDRVDAMFRSQDLRSVYQPVIELDGNTTVGYEALSRFGDASARRPDQWFADGFAAGRGVELEWLAATTSLSALDSLPPEQFLALNMSAATILHIDEEQVCDPAVCPRIVVELTEHVPVEDYSALHRALAQMRSYGARLAADDLGAGYAGFRHLLRLEPDIIKLDISLVGGIHRSKAQQALAKALIAFATEMGAVIVAEGVEDADELAVLHDLGVPWVQGNLLGRPQPFASTAPLRPHPSAPS